MAIDTSVTLRRLIAEFSEWATAHPMVNDFGYGQYLETFRSSENKYAAVIVNSPSATSENFFINYSLEIICLDYVLDQNDNRDRVNSDTMDILRDIENTIRYSIRWKQFSRADGQWSYRKVDEFGADKCFGWVATFVLKIKKKHGICDIKSLMPTYDFEMGAVVYPSCDPVTFKINGADEDEFASGDEFDLTLVDTDGNTPVYSYDDVLKKLIVPASSSASIDIAVNGTSFYTGVSTNQNLPVKKSDGTTNSGSKVGANWQIGDSTVNIKDSAGTTLYAKTVLAEGTADQIVSDGSVTLQDIHGNTLVSYTNKAQEAKVVQLPIIYFHPANSGYGSTSFLTGDEGWNEVNRPRPSVPSCGVPALLNPLNPRKLLYPNIYNHLHRFVGANGGYYDYDTGTFHLADGTLSDVDTVFGTIAGNTSYWWDTHTQIGIKWNTQSAGTWVAKSTEILALNHAGFSDWFLPSLNQEQSKYATFDLGTNRTSIIPFNIAASVKTSTPTFGSETTFHVARSVAAQVVNRSDGIADAAYAVRWHHL